MTTFVLKKYEDEKRDTTIEDVEHAKREEEIEGGLEEGTDKTGDVKLNKEAYISATGTISEIVFKALQKTFANVEEISTDKGDQTSTYKAVTTEDINNNPVDTLNSINKDDSVFIHTDRPFTTSKEEWFLTNINNKTKNVFYSVESFVKHLENEFN